jgi:hypothetical protein
MIPEKMTRREAGLVGARKRWGPDGRVVRLDSLDPVTREIVVSILRARKNAAEAKAAAPPDPRAA